MATRKELEDRANELGIENPEKFSNMDQLQDAIDQKETGAQNTTNGDEPEGTREGIVDEPSDVDRPDHDPESTEQPQDEHSLSPSAGENTDWDRSDERDDQETRAEAVEGAREAAQENHDAVQVDEGEEPPTGAELDGTADLEVEGTNRRDAIRQGQETAQANVERERAENDQAGE